MISKLFVLPTFETLELFQDLFDSLPFSVDWNALGVEIGSSHDVIDTNENPMYRAQPGGMDIWYDTQLARSLLILPLIPSPEMVARASEVGDAWSRQYFLPRLVFGTPNSNRRRAKAIMNSIADALVDRKPILTFHGEVVIPSPTVVAAQQDYYEDAVRRGFSDLQFLALGDEARD